MKKDSITNTFIILLFFMKILFHNLEHIFLKFQIYLLNTFLELYRAGSDGALAGGLDLWAMCLMYYSIMLCLRICERVRRNASRAGGYYGEGMYIQRCGICLSAAASRAAAESGAMNSERVRGWDNQLQGQERTLTANSCLKSLVSGRRSMSKKLCFKLIVKQRFSGRHISATIMNF